MSDTITVPVTLAFNNDDTIGYMTIDTTRLPTSANFVFALGVKVMVSDENVQTMSPYELVSVGVVSDGDYAKYLENQVMKRCEVIEIGEEDE